MNKMRHLPDTQALCGALITFCVCYGITLALCSAMALTVGAHFIARCCASVAFVVLLGDTLPRLRPIVYALVFGLIAVIAVRGAEQIASVRDALILLANGQPLALAAYSRPIAVLLCLLTGGMCGLLTDYEHALPLLCVISLLILWLLSAMGVQGGVGIMLPLALAMLLSCRVRSVSLVRIAVSCLSVLLLCAPLLRAGVHTVPTLSSFAQSVRRTIDDYFFFDDPRTTFSLSSVGWQPLGPNVLGGPVAPSDEPVMQVRVGGSAYLRGAIKDQYTGSAWRSSAAGRRYLLISPRNAAYRKNMFDQNRPSKALRERYLTREPIEVLILADTASTLYLTQRFSGVTGPGIVPYYSPAGEVFATHDLKAGERYAFYGSRFTAHSKGAREAVLAAYDEDDALPEDIYLQISQSTEPGVYALTEQITRDAQTDFDRAIAICRYLKGAYAYTHNQNVPPPGRDFVSWFLLTEGRGYCTSFASAMTVMARIAGLPARYIEGFLAEPDADGLARVTQRDAHAWTEIYLKGFGWLTFDATPGENDATPAFGDAPSAGDGPEDGDAPTPSPEPNPSPEPSPEQSDPGATPEPTPGPTSSPKPSPQSTDPGVTPAADPSPVPTPTPPAPGGKTRRTAPLLLFLLLLLVSALCALRLYTASPTTRMRGRSPSEALYMFFAATQDLLLCMGIPSLPGETPAAHFARAQAQLGIASLSSLARSLYEARYGARKLSAAHVRRAEKTYLSLLRRAKWHQRLRLYAKRVLRGAAK